MSSEIVTFTGRIVDPLNLKPEKVNIIDIAHSLALQCRFTGHVRWHYSVGQHSVLATRFAADLGYPVKVQKGILIHDGSEAYCADLARPVKHAAGLGEAYRAVEDAIQAVVAARFGVKYPFASEIHLFDNAMLAAEQRDLMPRFRHIETPLVYPYPIERWDPEYTEDSFLDLYEELFRETPRR